MSLRMLQKALSLTYLVGGEVERVGGGARARTYRLFDGMEPNGTKKYCCSGTSPVLVNTPQYQVSIASTAQYYLFSTPFHFPFTRKCI